MVMLGDARHFDNVTKAKMIVIHTSNTTEIYFIIWQMLLIQFHAPTVVKQHDVKEMKWFDNFLSCGDMLLIETGFWCCTYQ